MWVWCRFCGCRSFLLIPLEVEVPALISISPLPHVGAPYELIPQKMHTTDAVAWTKHLIQQNDNGFYCSLSLFYVSFTCSSVGPDHGDSFSMLPCSSGPASFSHFLIGYKPRDVNIKSNGLTGNSLIASTGDVITQHTSGLTFLIDHRKSLLICCQDYQMILYEYIGYISHKIAFLTQMQVDLCLNFMFTITMVHFAFT